MMRLQPHCSVYNNNLIAVMSSCPESKRQKGQSPSHPHPLALRQGLTLLQSQIQALREEGASLRTWAEQAAGEARAVAGEWAGKVGHLVFRQAREKLQLQSQIEKSRTVQSSMRGEVIALKEMVQAAVEDYQQQLQRKDLLLKEKDEEIQILIKQIKALEGRPPEQSLRVEQSRKSHVESLQIIQEESEIATHSSMASLRDFREEDKQLHSQIGTGRRQQDQQEVVCKPVVHSSPEVEIERESCEPRFEHKRTKTFIDHFRKTIGESFSEKEQQRLNPANQRTPKNATITQSKISNNPPQTHTKQPLKELSSNDQANKAYSFSQNLKQPPKQPPKQPLHNPAIPPIKTLTLLVESKSISSSSSSSDLIISGQAERISLPKKFQTPINLMSFKKKDPAAGRVMTEPSPERHDRHQGGNYFSSKQSSHKRIFHEKKSSCEKSQHSMQDSKSVKSSLSREKIKITAKMVDDALPAKRPGTNPKAVYLGGKSVFRKFLLELKTALRQYAIITVFPEVKYEGGRRNGVRWGQGRIVYQNGCLYQGQFREGVRWGKGRLTVNGIAIYQGDWVNDRTGGQGYIKSMRFMGSGGGAIFNQASYCGNLLQGKLHGIGTLFLNAKEKIVTKFHQGIPTGQLTYYNFHEIEFGVWPSE